MVWAASVALVRICAASCIERAASSTVVTAASGSETVPEASAWEAESALFWVLSSEEIASVSELPKLEPVPPLVALGGRSAQPDPFGLARWGNRSAGFRPDSCPAGWRARC